MTGRGSTLIRVAGAFAAALGGAGLLLVAPTAAGASGSGSPPVSPVPTSCSVSTLITIPVSGTPQNGSLTEDCPFAPGSSATLSYGGVPLGTVTSDGNGLVTLAVTATDPHLSFDGGSTQPAIFGINTVTAVGLNASGASNTATFLIDIVQGVTTSAATTDAAAEGVTGGTSSGGLAFTGADLAALVAAAFVLVVLGLSVVSFTRRRAAQSSRKS